MHYKYNFNILLIAGYNNNVIILLLMVPTDIEINGWQWTKRIPKMRLALLQG